MVRTFLCHPFIEPKAFTDNFEPTAICFPHNDCMIISSSNGSIQIYDLKQDGHPQLNSFTATGVPVGLLYSDNKEFIVSLETRVYDYKPLKSQRDLNCQVYIYWNFQNDAQSKMSCLVHAEYTKNIKGSTFSTYTNKFPVIDIGIYDPVMDIALCKINSNIALSARNKVFIYVFKEMEYRQSNNDQIRLIDFFKIIEIDTSFHVRSLSICNNYLVFASRRELRAVQFYLHRPDDQTVYQGEDVSFNLEACSTDGSENKAQFKDEQHMNNITNNITLDDNFTVWGVSPSNNISHGKQKSCLTKSEWESFDKCSIKLNTVSKEAPYTDGSLCAKEVIGPVEDIVGHPFAISLSNSFTNVDVKSSEVKTGVSAITLLYRRFEADEMSTSDTIDSVHSLQWLPVFISDPPSEERPNIPQNTWPWNCFQHPPSLTSFYFTLFFSTGMQGFVYSIGLPVKCVASYGYTSDCSMALHTNSFLYAVTKSGLEAYTSRLYPLVAELYKTAAKTGEHKIDPTGCNEQKKCVEFTKLFNENEYSGQCYDPLQHQDLFGSNCTDTSFMNSWFPGIPKYSPQTLLLPCPPKTLEYCLVGLFALPNIKIVGASSSYIGLLIKAKDKNGKRENSVTPWSVYNLSKAPICEFFDELIALVEGNELSNPTVYHQLLCEGHLMLRSELILGTLLKDQIEFHLRFSARKIAEFLARCDNTFDVSQICGYYSMAGITFKDAVVSYMDAESSVKKVIDVQDGQKFPSKKTIYGHGMMLYLNSVLFGDNEIELEKELGDFILKVYLEIQPSMLTKVILKSKLKNISYELAIKYINKHKKKYETKGTMLNPFDCLCLAVLQMKVGNPNKAESLLGEISEESLQKICERHEFILFDSQMQMTPFGQLVKKYFKGSLVVILVLMFEHGKITVQQILNLFQDYDKDGNTSYSYSVCEILERLLNDHTHKKHFHKISLFLAEQYVYHIAKGTLTKNLKNCYKHVPKGNGHFATRFAWLNNMDPFSGEPSLSEDCKLNNSPSLRARNKGEVRINCGCCCCNEILLKLQSLLCSRHNRKDLSSGILIKLSEMNFNGRESLMLLCWPKADCTQEAVECIVRNHPKQCLQYARDMFDWKAQWQLLLQFILAVLKNNEYELWNYDAYLTLLRGVLLRLARAYMPAEFLTFLPEDGMASFFLPYIHECWEFSRSSSLKQQFIESNKAPFE